MKIQFLVFCSLIMMVSCTAKTQISSSEAAKEVEKSEQKMPTEAPDFERLEKSEDDWKAELSEFEYYVIREKGTERSFTGNLLEVKEEGTYKCKACGLDLFYSDTKFDSRTGWPSFYQPIKEVRIKEDTDYHLGYARTEVMCARCDGHLGHVFKDGPKPTGLRYCINSVSLTFEGK